MKSKARSILGRTGRAVAAVGALAALAVACDVAAPLVSDQAPADSQDATAASAGAATFVAQLLENPPIVYVDGIRVDSLAFETLVPLDIERIEIVKGEEAKAEFGDEGANGVIQVFLRGEAEGSPIRK